MAWDNIDFAYHFYFGNGASKTLSEIGLLEAVKAESNKLAIDRAGGFKDQIRNKAREVKEGAVVLKFENSYSFSNVKFALGSGVLKGDFTGTSTSVLEGKYFVSGKISIAYSDRFTDPISVIEYLYGSSDSPDAPDWVKKIGELGGTAYDTTDQWQDDFSSDVLLIT